MTSIDSNLTLSWKRPWTVEEIIESSQCWSLAADSGVCELLKSFSTDLLNEVSQVNNNINELSVESKQTNVIIQNAFNEFCMLANNQFMENLVEDVASCPLSDENIKNNNESYPSKEDKLAQIIPQVSESLKMGFMVLENQFEMMDMQKTITVANPDDSDNEMRSYAQTEYATNEPIYHPKDPYENRHLPHLIGTKAFIEDDTLGIGYLDDLENQSESVVSAHSDKDSDAGDLTSSFSDDSAELADDNATGPVVTRPKSTSDSDKMFSDNSQSETDLFAEDKPSSIKKTDVLASRPLSLADQLHNQLKQKLGVERNEETSHEQKENSLADSITKKTESSPLDESKRKITPLQPSANITRPLSASGTDDDSDDLFADNPSSKKKVERQAVNNSLTKMPPSVIPSISNNVGKSLDVKSNHSKSASKELSKPSSLFGSDSEESSKEITAPKPSLRNKKKLNVEKENRNLKETSSETTSNKIHSDSKLVSESDDDDLFGPKFSKPSILTPVVKPVPKKNLNFSISDDDDLDIFNTNSETKPPPPPPSHLKSAIKSNIATSSPKVESKKEVDNKIPKTKKPASAWLDSSSDDDIFNQISNHKTPLPSKPSNDLDSLKEQNNSSISTTDEKSKEKIKENIPSKDITKPSVLENIKDQSHLTIIQTNNCNSSTNNSDENQDEIDSLFNSNTKNEPKSSDFKISNKETKKVGVFQDEDVDDFDNLFNSNKKDEPKSSDFKISNQETKKVGVFQDENVDDFDNLFNSNKKNEPKSSDFKISNQETKTKVLNHSKINVIDPLSQPDRKIPLNLSDNPNDTDTQITDSNKSPAIIPRSSISNNQKNNAGSGILDTSSPQNSTNLPDVESIRESLPKLPPGATPIFGISLMDEMKNHRKSKLSLKSEAVLEVKSSNYLSSPDKIDPLEPSENKTEINEQSNKQDFRNMLQSKLNMKPFINPVERVNKSEITNENEIDLEKPPEEVRQLTLLTKSRAKINPRRRPTVKKAAEVDTTPISNPVIPDNEADSIPQPIVDPTPISILITNNPQPIADPTPIITNNQSDDTINIFADLPNKPDKKSKSNKKSAASSGNKIKKPVEVNVEEIDDIFAVATSKPKKAKNKSKVVSDPLGAL